MVNVKLFHVRSWFRLLGMETVESYNGMKICRVVATIWAALALVVALSLAPAPAPAQGASEPPETQSTSPAARSNYAAPAKMNSESDIPSSTV